MSPVPTRISTLVGGRPLLISGGEDGIVRLWDPDTGNQLMMMRRRAIVNALAGYGPSLAIGDEEGLSVIDIS